jgi:hypothetical protein
VTIYVGKCKATCNRLTDPIFACWIVVDSISASTESFSHTCGGEAIAENACQRAGRLTNLTYPKELEGRNSSIFGF